jgi:hypothetical protein
MAGPRSSSLNAIPQSICLDTQYPRASSAKCLAEAHGISGVGLCLVENIYLILVTDSSRSISAGTPSAARPLHASTDRSRLIMHMALPDSRLHRRSPPAHSKRKIHAHTVIEVVTRGAVLRKRERSL